MISTIWEKTRLRIYGSFIRFIRLGQDLYVKQMMKHQEAYNDLDERSFRALRCTLLIGIYKDLYWFCVANARYRDG